MTPDSKAKIEIDNNVVTNVSKFKFLDSLVQRAPQMFNTENKWRHKNSAD